MIIQLDSATTDNMMCHLTIGEGTGDGGATWLESVADHQYAGAQTQ